MNCKECLHYWMKEALLTKGSFAHTGKCYCLTCKWFQEKVDNFSPSISIKANDEMLSKEEKDALCNEFNGEQ